MNTLSRLGKLLRLPMALLFVALQFATAQTYSRKSLSIMMLQYYDDKPISSDHFGSLYVPKRFDHNHIGINSLFLNRYFSNAESIDESEINTLVQEKQIPNKILRSILVDERLGHMTTQLIEDRGLYNATDAEYVAAKSSARGLNILKDAGVQLLQNIYFLVIKPTSVSSYYNEQLQSNEYTFGGTGYLYQLDLDSVYMVEQFWKDFYFDSPNTAMLNKLMTHRFPLKYAAHSFSVTVSDVNTADKMGSGFSSLLNTLSNSNNSTNNANTYTVTRKSESQIKGEALEKILQSCLYSITSSEDFTIKSSVLTTHPIRAKLGTKESLKSNDLYRVVERVMDERTNKVLEKRKGYVRAKWVAYNEGRSTAGISNASSFYRIATGKIEKGMLLEEASEDDHRWTMGFNYNSDTSNLMSGYYMNFEKITSWLPGMSWAVDVGINPTLRTHSVELDDVPVSGYFKGFSFTTALTFRQSFSYNHVALTPLAGPSFSFLGLSDGNVVKSDGTVLNAENMSSLYGTNVGLTLGFAYGADLGINLSKSIQLRAGIRFHHALDPLFFDLNSIGKSSTDYSSSSVWDPYTGTYVDTSTETTKYSFEYTPKFKAQFFSIGIRLFNL